MPRYCGIFFINPDNKNQLLKVNDLSNSPQGFKDNYTSNENDFSYDNNGNMTADVNKEIESITYNHLNLPIKINFGAKGNISYLYNALGQKVQKKVVDASTTNTTDYLTGFQYKNTILDFFAHAEGYVKFNYGRLASPIFMFSYVFNYTDHLGNIRVSYSKDPSTNVLKILEENHYYPFGLKHTNYNSDKLMYIKEADVYRIRPVAPVLQTYKYKYNGKELQEELGLNMYDYGARNYDAAIGRTTTYDPLAEKFYSISPQSFLNNNPLYFIDPTGMKADGWITQMVDGNASHTYEKDINTVEEAKAAGYENVSQVSQSMTISNSSYNYSYSLNSDGSVTNTSSGTNAQFQTAIKDGMFVVGGSMTTAGGSTINTTNLGSNPLDALPKASGRIEAMEFSSPFFPAGMIFKSLGRAVTTADGFLFGSITAKTPFNIPVQRFGQMSYGRSDFWGLQLGTSKFVNRTFVAIKPEWNSLTQFTSGVIPKGTSMQFGIVGPQGLAYPGGSLQFLVNSKSVINQSSKVIPR